jgi:hypothetical protein
MVVVVVVVMVFLTPTSNEVGVPESTWISGLPLTPVTS